MSSSISRWFRSIEAAAVAGLAFAVLSFIALLLLTSSPDPSVPDSEMTSWYADSANRTSLTIGLSLSIVAAISFLWFVAVIGEWETVKTASSPRCSWEAGYSSPA